MKKKNCYTFATLFQKASRLDSLAQLVEHNTFNVGVLGSSPRRITEKEGCAISGAAFFMALLGNVFLV